VFVLKMSASDGDEGELMGDAERLMRVCIILIIGEGGGRGRGGELADSVWVACGFVVEVDEVPELWQ
jgi:hypothetical protein